MQHLVTKELLLLLQKGEHKAFEQVFIAYFNKVKYFIERIIRSENDAEELAQDIFIKLWINRESIDANKSISSYLFTLARNAAFNYLKHQQVEEAYVHDQFIRIEEVSDTEEILYAKEIALLIEMTVNKMPEQRKRIYRLSRDSGLTNTEIAGKLNISKKTVENQLSLALKELRKAVILSIIFLS